MGLTDMFVAAKAKNDLNNAWTSTKDAFNSWYSGSVSEEKRNERNERTEQFEQAKQERSQRKSKLTEQWASHRAANSSTTSSSSK